MVIYHLFIWQCQRGFSYWLCSSPVIIPRGWVSFILKNSFSILCGFLPRNCSYLSLENFSFAPSDILSHFPDGSLEPYCSWASLSELPHCLSYSEPKVVSLLLLSAPNHFSIIQWMTGFYFPPYGYWVSLIASCGGAFLRVFLFGLDRLCHHVSLISSLKFFRWDSTFQRHTLNFFPLSKCLLSYISWQWSKKQLHS
jgi:hypothetical protein